MQIAGIQKTTLVDYPGKIAATVFLRGCNFRCGFCHNPEIVLPHRFEGTIPEEEFFRFLESRLGKIQGICITGGEPLLWKDTAKFISHIKALGFAVKLDTNGSYPERLGEIIKEGDLDYIAMDIKSPFHKYEMATNSKFKSLSRVTPRDQNLYLNPNLQNSIKKRKPSGNFHIENYDIENSLKIAPKGSGTEKLKIENLIDGIEKKTSSLEQAIEKSIKLIMSSGLDYEFRTTVAKPLHEVEDFLHIGEMIKGAKKYFIQNFVQSKHIDEKTPFSPFSLDDLKLAEATVAPFVESVGLR